MSKRYVVRKPWDGEYNPETVELDARGVTQSAREYDAWLEDTASPGRVVHGDGGAPEDQTLLRDLSSFVDELNALADALVQAEKLAASRYQQIEELKGQVAFQKAQADAYLTDKRIVQQQYDAFRVQVKEPSMTDTIEPTEEQMQAAKSFVHSEFGLAPSIQFLTPRIARLFAEREAALLALVQHAQMSSMARAADLDAARAEVASLRECISLVAVEASTVDNTDLDAARARIADLEVQASRDAVSWAALKGRERELEEREAAYLAQIKALTDALADLVLVSAPGMETLLDVSRDAARALLAARPGVDGWQLKAGAR